MNGDLDAWPENAADLRAMGGASLAGHIFFPNSWSGPDDLSARLRLAHDGEKLYVGAEIWDDVLEAKDACTFQLSRQAYVDWRGQAKEFDLRWPVVLPVAEQNTKGNAGGFQYASCRIGKGYVVEGAVSLANLGIRPGGSIGFLLSLADTDGTPNLAKPNLNSPVKEWAKKQSMLVPHRPLFTYWSDARTCGKLTLE
jgi:hypothetical protein